MSHGMKGEGPAARGGLRAALVAVAAGLALGLPPEVHPLSGVLLALLLAAALWAARPGPSPSSVLPALALGGFQLAISLAPGRSLGVLSGWALAFAAFWAARGAATRLRGMLPGVLAVIGAGLGLLAAAQRLGLMALDAAAARGLGLSTEVILRLEQGRPFGTHVVPAALAGALVLAGLVAAANLARGGRQRGLVLACLPLILLGLVLTASLGAWLGLSAGAGAVLLVAGRRLSRRSRVLGAAAVVLLAAVLVAVRPVSVADLSRPDNPLRLRLGNWRGAVLMAAEQPVTGTGVGSFGALYPRYRRAGDSQTIYAHNSWLQVAVEGGWPALALLVAGVVLFYRRWRGIRNAGDGLWLLAALLAFAVHNLVDFTAYLPGLVIPAAILAGLVFEPGARRTQGLPHRGGGVARVALLALLVAAAGWWAVESASRQAMDRAVVHARQAPARAAAEAVRAARLAPWSTSRAVAAGNLLLAAGDPNALAALGGLLPPMLDLDGFSPAPWHLLARWRLARGEVTAAWEAYRQAAVRHPAAPELARQIAMIEAALADRGLIGGEPSPRPGKKIGAPAPPAWQGWDDMLVLVGGLMLLLVGVRLQRVGLVPALAVALSLVCLISAFGEGGALPGVRLARALVVALALSAWLLGAPRRSQAIGKGGWLVGAILVAVASSSALAPAGLAARDGLLSVSTAAALLVLSFWLAAENPRWLRICLTVVVAAASLEGALWLVQKGLLMAGMPLEVWAPPLGTLNPLRPAGDFLHPGHLGTFLVVGAVASLGTGGGAGLSRRRGALALLLVLAGLSGGSRATLLALVAAGGVLASCAASRRLRRAVMAVMAGSLLFGGGVVLWRLGFGDPYAWTRTRIWSAALAALSERPWLGFGPGGFAPLAAHWGFEDPGPVAHWSRTFSGPHSDLLGLLLAVGLPTGLLVLLVLGSTWRRVWLAARQARDLAPVAALAAVTAMLAHGLVDDLFSERPAVWVVAALLAGACLATVRGCAGESAPGPGRGLRRAAVVVVLVAVVAGEVLPWAADRAFRAGAPQVALGLEPHSGRYAAALLEPPPASLEAAASRLEWLRRLRRARSYDSLTWVRGAELEERLCREVMPEQGACARARAGWSAALARRPEDVFARRLRARLRAHLGLLAEAEDDLRLALASEPNFLGARLDLVRVSIEQGRAEEARAQWMGFRSRVRELSGVRPASRRGQALLEVSPGEVAQVEQRLERPAPVTPPVGSSGREP